MHEISKIFNEKAQQLQEDNVCRNGFYHYTSLDALENILCKKYFRMSHFECFNDPLEIQFSKHIFDEQVRRNFAKNDTIKKELEKAKDLLDLLLKDTEFYIFSFSKKDYLPCWRWYADNGCGVSIGFSENFFKVVDIDAISKEESPYVLTQVDYGANVCFKILNNLTNVLANFLMSQYLDSSEKEELIQLYALHLFSLLPAFKHPDYQHEEETRFYKINVKKEVHGFLKIPDEIKDHFQRRRKIQLDCGSFKEEVENVPYIKKSITKDDITEIITGPRHTGFEKTRVKINHLLSANGFDCDKVKILPSLSLYKG